VVAAPPVFMLIVQRFNFDNKDAMKIGFGWRLYRTNKGLFATFEFCWLFMPAVLLSEAKRFWLFHI